MKKKIFTLFWVVAVCSSIFSMDFGNAGNLAQIKESYNLQYKKKILWIIPVTRGYYGYITFDFNISDKYGKVGNDFYVKPGTILKYKLGGVKYTNDGVGLGGAGKPSGTFYKGNTSVSQSSSYTSITLDSDVSFYYKDKNENGDTFDSKKITFHVIKDTLDIDFIGVKSNWLNIEQTFVAKIKETSNLGIGIQSLDSNYPFSKRQISSSEVELTFKIDKEGSNNISVTAKDNLNNINSKSVIIQLDYKKPTLKITANENWINGPVIVTATGNDPKPSGVNEVSGLAEIKFSYKKDGIFMGERSADNESTNNEKQYSFNLQGLYDCSIYAIDNAGNSSEIQTATVKIDTEAPEINVEGVGKKWITKLPSDGHKVTVTVQDQYSGIGDLSVKVDGEEIADKIEIGKEQHLQEVEQIFTEDGKYKVEINANDNVGIKSKTTTGEIWIDTKAPTVNLTGIDDSKWNNLDTEVTITFTDNVSGFDKDEEFSITDNGVDVSRNLKKIEDLSTDRNWVFKYIVSKDNKIVDGKTIIGQGTHYIKAKIKDIAGHESNEVSGKVLIDSSALTETSVGSEFSPLMNAYRGKLGITDLFKGDVQAIIFSAKEMKTDASRPKEVRYSLNDVVYDSIELDSEGNGKLDVSGASSGEYVFKFVDEAGNITERPKVDLEIDRKAEGLSATDIDAVEEKNNGKEQIYVTISPSSSETYFILYYPNETGFGNPAAKDVKVVYKRVDESPVTVDKLLQDKNTSGIYTLYVEAVDQYGNFNNGNDKDGKGNPLYLLWRNEVDAPVAELKYERVFDENGTSSLKSFIEIDIPSEISEKINGKERKFERSYFYKNSNNKLDRGSKINSLKYSGKYRIYTSEIKNKINWASDEENERKISVYYTETYTVPDEDKNVIKSKLGSSVEKEIIVKDFSPIFNNCWCFDEYVGESAIIRNKEEKPYPMFEDPDGDVLLYKVTKYSNKNPESERKENYLYEQPTSVSIEKDWDYEEGLTIIVEAKGIRVCEEKNFADCTEEELVDIWNKETTKSGKFEKVYAKEKIDTEKPEIETWDEIFTGNGSWTNRKEAEFVISDKTSGLKIIKATFMTAEGKKLKEEEISLVDGEKKYIYKTTLIDENGNTFNGDCYVIFYIEDKAGNVYSGISENGKFDTIAPVIKNVKSETDTDGYVKVKLEVFEEGSGVIQYSWKTDGDWSNWSKYYSENFIYLSSDNFSGDERNAFFKVRDYRNESEEYKVDFASYKEMSEIKTFVFSGINEKGYVTDISKFWPVIILADESDVSQYKSEWKIAEKNVNEDSYASFEELRETLVDGKKYGIEVKLTNKYGSSSSKIGKDFRVETSKPEDVKVSIVGDVIKGRQFEVIVEGGLDDSCSVMRTVELFNKETEEVLWTGKENTGAKIGTVKIPGAMYEREFEEGNIYVRAKSVNDAGLASGYSNEEKVLAAEASGKLFVTADEYTAGSLAVNWTAGSEGTEYYSYCLKTASGKEIIYGSTETEWIVIDVEELVSEKNLIVYVTAYDSEGNQKETGQSNIITYCTRHPDSEWINVPEAVLSTRLWAEYSVTDMESGVARCNWALEIFESEKIGDEEIWAWNGTGENKEREWIELTDCMGEIEKDLSGLKATGRISDGSLVRVILSGENKAGYVTQVTTGGITVDDSLPPKPVVTDSGSVVNQMTPIKADWGTSFLDSESGSTFYWRSYLAGRKNAATEWKEADWEEKEKDGLFVKVQKMNVTTAAYADSKYDGDVLYFEVKAVNGAGSESIGRSNGILLDSNAPEIEEIVLYSDETERKCLSGFVKNNELNETVYMTLNAEDATSWINNAEATLYEINDFGTEIKEDSLELVKKESKYSAEIGISKFREGSRFIVYGTAEDEAGNRTGSAASESIVFVGAPEEIRQIFVQGDTKCLNINWTTTGSKEWTNSYFVTVLRDSNGNNSVSKLVKTKSATLTWEELGIRMNESDGDILKITVKAIGYAGDSAGLTSNYTIDLHVPQFLEKEKLIPNERRLIAWADKLTAHVEYSVGVTGTSTEWSAVYPVDGTNLTDWNRRQNAGRLDVSKNISDLGREEIFWQNKYVMLRFRAVNGMGISSPVKNTTALKIDLTAPETAETGRDWVWTNRVVSLDEIRILGGDKDTGLISYVTALVKNDELKEKGIERIISEEKINETEILIEKNSILEKNNEEIPIVERDEGQYVAILGVRNGSGLWTYVTSEEIEIDRTEPKLESIIFNGTWEEDVTLSNEERKHTYVTNGPYQKYDGVSNEEVRWCVKGDGNTFKVQKNENGVYESNWGDVIDFSEKTEGNCYSIIFEMTDRAGNTGISSCELRYNKAPSITIKYDSSKDENEKKIIVWPGHKKTIYDLIEVNDRETDVYGEDYPLTYTWDAGNGNPIYTWTGGNSEPDILGDGAEYETTYFQEGKSQTSEYKGVLSVKDCYGKERNVEITVTVENTRFGELLTDEYWTGDYTITGIIVVPEGKKITFENADITAGGYMNGSFLNSGFDIRGTGEAFGDVSFKSESDRTRWKGIKVGGIFTGNVINITGAQRGFTLLDGGRISINSLDVSECLTGLHLFGGIFETNGLKVTNNIQYGVKEETSGIYEFGNADISGNGKNFYKNGKTE